MIEHTTFIDDREEYKLNGKHHRANGPAFRWKKAWWWYLYGEHHRYYGPCFNNGSWYIHGKCKNYDE